MKLESDRIHRTAARVPALGLMGGVRGAAAAESDQRIEPAGD